MLEILQESRNGYFIYFVYICNAIIRWMSPDITKIKGGDLRMRLNTLLVQLRVW